MDDRRLNKYIADAGFCSRREADRLIAAGQVKINGQVAGIGQKVQEGAVVTVAGEAISPKGDKVYIALHKPVGIVSTVDPREPHNIADFVGFPGRIYPIGRLDKDSSGLILMTSDGDIVNRILRSEGLHQKEYEVQVDKPLTADFLNKMATGVPILGQVTLPARLTQTGANTFRIVLVQGLNRQIRRMCETLGYQVQKLSRIRIMHITLGKLRPGEWRFLSQKELTQLMDTLEQSGKEKTKQRKPRCRPGG